MALAPAVRAARVAAVADFRLGAAAYLGTPARTVPRSLLAADHVGSPSVTAACRFAAAWPQGSSTVTTFSVASTPTAWADPACWFEVSVPAPTGGAAYVDGFAEDLGGVVLPGATDAVAVFGPQVGKHIRRFNSRNRRKREILQQQRQNDERGTGGQTRTRKDYHHDRGTGNMDRSGVPAGY